MFSHEEQKLLGALTFGYFLLFQFSLSGDVKEELEEIMKDEKAKELHQGIISFHAKFMEKKAQVLQLQTVLKKELKEQAFFEEQIEAGKEQLETYDEMLQEIGRKLWTQLTLLFCYVEKVDRMPVKFAFGEKMRQGQPRAKPRRSLVTYEIFSL